MQKPLKPQAVLVQGRMRMMIRMSMLLPPPVVVKGGPFTGSRGRRQNISGPENSFSENIREGYLGFVNTWVVWAE